MEINLICNNRRPLKSLTWIIEKLYSILYYKIYEINDFDEIWCFLFKCNNAIILFKSCKVSNSILYNLVVKVLSYWIEHVRFYLHYLWKSLTIAILKKEDQKRYFWFVENSLTAVFIVKRNITFNIGSKSLSINPSTVLCLIKKILRLFNYVSNLRNYLIEACTFGASSALKLFFDW